MILGNSFNVSWWLLYVYDIILGIVGFVGLVGSVKEFWLILGLYLVLDWVCIWKW